MARKGSDQNPPEQAPKRLPEVEPPKSPLRPGEDAMPPYTPGGVPEPEAPPAGSPAEHTPLPDTYPPKRAP